MMQPYKCPFHYIGSKAKLLPQILPLIDSVNPKCVIDVFAGGFSVGANVKCKKVVYNDKCNELTELIKYFYYSNTQILLDKIDEEIFKRKLSKTNTQAYKNLRDEYNVSKEPLLLYLLICFSFNHQIRFNSMQKFNTPFGKNRSSYNVVTKAALKDFIRKIKEKDIEFHSFDFSNFEMFSFPAGSVFFFDPPYTLSTGSYNDGKRGNLSWDVSDEIRLYDFLKSVDKGGYYFVLTNFLNSGSKKNTLLEDFCSHFLTRNLSSDYTNSNYHKSASSQKEILVTNISYGNTH